MKVDEKTVTEADGWQYSFNNLPVYKNGNKIKYAIAEDAVENYSTTITGYNITNKYTPQQTSLSVLKRWNDSENQDGKRPNSVTVQLLADGKQYGDLVTLNSSGNWMYTWRGLPMYKDGGTPIQYTVQETSTLPDGYITNSYTPKTTTITGVKTWDDGNNQDGKRPSQITVKLLADGIEADRTVAEADENGEWKYSFSNLPKFRNGKEISYSVIEDGVPDYSTQTSVTVTKVWDDGNNQDGIRPESVQVQLYADGKASGDPVTLNSDGNWTYTWDNLDQMKSGTEIVYTAEEVTSIDGYTSSVSGNAAEGFTITNHHTPAEKTIVTEDTNSSGGHSSPSASTLNLVPDTADHTDVLRHGITAILSLTTALIAAVAYKRYQ